MSNRYLDKISKTRHCVNGVPMASACECVYFNRHDDEPDEHENEDGSYNQIGVTLEEGEVSLYVDGVFKFGPIRGRATITLK